MTTLAIIGGRGLSRMDGLTITRREMVKTPYGAASCPLIFGTLADQDVVFLTRHGNGYSIAPHRINYCANIWALHSVGVNRIIAISAVGGISEDCVPGALVFPEQIIDYTHGRESTFDDEEEGDAVTHIDFTSPYDSELRGALISAARASDGIAFVDHGTYGATQGPRFETAAEIIRMERDGCTIVGMTGMPEAALARELDMAYACCSVVSNRAAGKPGPIDPTTLAPTLTQGMHSVQQLLGRTTASA